MIIAIILVVGTFIFIGAICARIHAMKWRKHKGEITDVRVKSVSGKKFTFEIHRGDAVSYEAYNIGSVLYNELIGMVKE